MVLIKVVLLFHIGTRKSFSERISQVLMLIIDSEDPKIPNFQGSSPSDFTKYEIIFWLR